MIPRSTPLRKTSDPPYIHADTHLATARSGRLSQVLLVRCPFCEPDTFHLHRAPLDFDRGRRTCPTTRCAYIVISAVLCIVRGAA